jgi:hypothetical protein
MTERRENERGAGWRRAWRSVAYCGWHVFRALARGKRGASVMRARCAS